MLSQLSDGLWGIIRSEDGMKNEIRETVQSVYATLSNPGGEKCRPSGREVERKIQTPVQGGETSSCPVSKQKQELIQGAVEESKGKVCNDEEDPELPPGFA